MISQTVEYALRSVISIAQAGGRNITAEEIARNTRVPVSYLSKVLQLLVKAQIIMATRGIHGGYSLTKSADSLAILDVVNAIDPLKRIHGCPLNLTTHGNQLCSLHRRLDAVLQEAENVFGKTTISDLLAESPVHPPLCEVAQVGVPVTVGAVTV
jgi:Rrf2 family protein